MARHITLAVTASAAAGPGIRRLTLQDPDGWTLPKTRPGAHVDLHVPGIGPRAYSLCGDPADATRWVVAVKREAASRGGSAWLHDGVAVGDTLAASMPRCTLPLAAATRHVMVAGGIGVTPFLSMAHALAAAGADWRLHVLHRGGLPCPADLAPFLASGHAVAHDTAAGRPALHTLLGSAAPGTHAYACGPAGLLAAFAEATATWPAGAAGVEHFVPPALPPDPSARPYTLVLAQSGASVAVPAHGNLAAALRALGGAVELSCEGGICGACRVRWLEGEPVHRDRVLAAADRATHLIACVAGCASARLVIDA